MNQNLQYMKFLIFNTKFDSFRKSFLRHLKKKVEQTTVFCCCGSENINALKYTGITSSLPVYKDVSYT